MRKLAANLLVICCTVLAAPVQAFLMTPQQDGSYEYFFAAPSLKIEAAGDLDLTGLSFIEGVADGFRVGANFALDWMGGEQAGQTPDITWSGIDQLPRSLSIISNGRLDLGATRLSLAGGNIFLTAQTINIGAGAMIDVGAGTITIPSPPLLAPLPGQLILNDPGQLVLAVPEPSNWVLLIAGFIALCAVARKKSVR